MPRSTDSTRPRSLIRFGLATIVIVVSVLLLVVVAGGVFVLGGDEFGYGRAGRPDIYIVQRGSFEVSVPASGELAALDQVEIASKLEARATITFIVDEGITVKAGDTLIRLDEKEILDRIKDAKDAVQSASTAWITAQSNLEIKRQANVAEVAKADLEIHLATLALEAWQKGEDISTRRKLQLELDTAEKEHERLLDRFETSGDLRKQEFISEDEYRRDEIELMRADSRWQQAGLALQVYRDYQREQDRAKFESDFKQAVDARDRIEQRHENEIKSLESDLQSKEHQLESKHDRLEKHERQLTLCTILAPQDGLVVYAASLWGGRHGGGNDNTPRIGTELRRNDPVIMLPDTSQMVAEVKVNEALSGKIQKGQTATIVSDAVPDQTLHGDVISVGVLAESGGWRDPNRRDYTVRIRLTDGNDLGLKPSMRCKANINVETVTDVISVPVQAIYHERSVAYAYVPDGAGYAQREIRLGRSSELFIEVEEGLAQGDAVLLREPSPDQITSRVRGDRNSDGREAGSGLRPAGKGAKRPERAKRTGAGGGRASQD